MAFAPYTKDRDDASPIAITPDELSPSPQANAFSVGARPLMEAFVANGGPPQLASQYAALFYEPAPFSSPLPPDRATPPRAGAGAAYTPPEQGVATSPYPVPRPPMPNNSVPSGAATTAPVQSIPVVQGDPSVASASTPGTSPIPSPHIRQSMPQMPPAPIARDVNDPILDLILQTQMPPEGPSSGTDRIRAALAERGLDVSQMPDAIFESMLSDVIEPYLMQQIQGMPSPGSPPHWSAHPNRFINTTYMDDSDPRAKQQQQAPAQPRVQG